ncbi:MAG: hypothetical protein JWM89_2875 [Acidimicrobiales bacterium]|nr:hypothetical protein [Acidimicrobiales bacterium]
MFRRSRSLLLVIGLMAPVAVLSGPASAAGPEAQGSTISQDLQLSATSGVPGDVITVSSASCAGAGNVDQYLSVHLVTGTAPDEELAAAGSSDGGAAGAELVVPDWADPAQPAVVEATCFTFGEQSDLSESYDPAPFDILPGAGAPAQLRTFSRTSLLAGQGFQVDVSGCNLAGADTVIVEVFATDDLTGRSLDAAFIDEIGFGIAALDGTGATVDVPLTNANFGISVNETAQSDLTIDGVDEQPLDIPAGTYLTVAYCAGETSSQSLFYEPQLVDITGAAPTGSIDLTVAPNSRTVDVAGADCPGGPVAVELDAISSADLFGPTPGFLRGHGTHSTPFRRARPATTLSSTMRLASDATAVRSGSARSTRAGQVVELNPTVDADGAWAATHTANFDDGVAAAFAVCGDPNAAGFYYDPQVARILVAPPVPTTTTTATPPAPVTPPPPAAALPGNPTFAG